MSEKFLWRTVRIESVRPFVVDPASGGRIRTDSSDHWRARESVEIRYRPDDLGSLGRQTHALETAFRNALLSPVPFTVTVTDDEVEAP